jgi:hypothetical protein
MYKKFIKSGQAKFVYDFATLWIIKHNIFGHPLFLPILVLQATVFFFGIFSNSLTTSPSNSLASTHQVTEISTTDIKQVLKDVRELASCNVTMFCPEALSSRSLRFKNLKVKN